MGWAINLIWVGLLFVAFVVGLLYMSNRNKHTVLKYRDINQSGCFTVGKSIK
jgi:hypothetical protein